MRKLLRVILVSAALTVLFLGFEHFFFRLPSIGDKPQDCCDQFVYTNRHGSPLILREDKSGGVAGLRPQTHYYVKNYITLGLIAFVGSAAIQLVVLSFKKRSTLQ